MEANRILKIFKPNKPILSLLGVEVIIGVLGEIMPDSLKKKILALISTNSDSSNSYLDEIWLLVFILTVFYFLWLSWKKEKSEVVEKATPLTPFDTERIKIIENLEGRYRDRRNQKLDERIKIDFSLRYTTIGMSKKFVEAYFVSDAKNDKEVNSTLFEVFEAHSHLLLVSESGGGKTLALLDLAIELLTEAKESNSIPFPVILNLRSWHSDKNFEDWLKDILISANGFSRRLAKDILDNRQILPFLDGFDLIPTDDLRCDCLESLREFLNKHGHPKFVICSALEKYKHTSIDAPVRAEILIEPFTLEKVKQQLQDIKDSKIKTSLLTDPISASNMLVLIEKSKTVSKTFCNPFYFNLATQIFEVIPSIKQANQQAKGFQENIVKSFVKGKLAETTNQFPNAHKNNFWLAWLAKLLNQYNEEEIELSFFQPGGLRFPRVYKFIAGLNLGIVLGVFLGLLAFYLNALADGFNNGLRIGIYTGLITFSVTGLPLAFLFILRRNPPSIKTKEVRVWKWSNLFSKFGFKIMLLTLLGCLFLPLFFKTFALALACSVMVIANSIRVLVLQHSYFTAIQTPYQRLKQGLFFNGFLIFLLFVVCSLIAVGFDNISRNDFLKSIDFSSSLIVFNTIFVFCLTILFCFSISFLFSPIHDHLILRFCFWLEGSMPLRYTSFLNYAKELRFLEQEGGQWRFRHKILQDYFANLEVEK